MKGFIKKSMVVLGFSGGLALGGGCETYRNLVDPCYPQRYEFASRQETVAAMAPQVYNGHVLDQTVWNYHFEMGTDKLTPGGMDHLAYLARRRPAPDASIFVQTAQDVFYDPAAPEKFSEARAALDSKRVQAVQNYLTAVTAGRHLAFEVSVHDPSEVGLAATPTGIAVQRHYLGYQGNLPTTAGAGASNVSGGGGAGAGAGGGGAASGGSGR
jgi:hypothetical protein